MVKGILNDRGSIYFQQYVCNIIDDLAYDNEIDRADADKLLRWIHAMLGPSLRFEGMTKPYFSWLCENNIRMDWDEIEERIIWLDRLIYELEEGRME